MCGIAGMIGGATAETIERMTSSLAHRGPDGGGTEFWPEHGLALGHRRLAIIDLSGAGRQPMASTDGRLAVTYNGEIYNYRELREELAGRGHGFRTRTDTEVLLAAYAEWGTECLPRLRGMFAFALADFGRGEVFLARDRFGIKPLVWAAPPEGFLFASELRALRASKRVSRTPDPQAVWDYLSLGSVPPPTTILRDVKALLPGHAMRVSFAGEILRSWRWYSLYEATREMRQRNVGLGRREAAEALREQLDDATRAHLVADVPVGAFLSGGVDSAAMVGLMARCSGKTVQTFTVGFEDRHAEFSETAAAHATAKHFRTDHSDLILDDPDIVQYLDVVLRALDQPSMDGMNTFFAAFSAAELTKVVLSGLGGDELFAGYPHFRRHRLAARCPQSLCAPLRLLPDRFRHNLMLPALTPCQRLATLRCLMYEQEKRRATAFEPQQPTERLPEGSVHGDLDPVGQISLYELEGYLARTLLRDGDAMSMVHGLEVRPILLDHKLAEFSFSLPSACKLVGNRPKAVFLEALADLLPEGVLRRRKRGFELPLLRWLSGPLLERADAAFSSDAAREWFSPAFLGDARRRLRAPSPRDFRLWAYFVLLEWLRA